MAKLEAILRAKNIVISTTDPRGKQALVLARGVRVNSCTRIVRVQLSETGMARHRSLIRQIDDHFRPALRAETWADVQRTTARMDGVR